MSGERFKTSRSSFGFEDVAKLESYIQGKGTMPFLTKSKAGRVYKRAVEALVQRYMEEENVSHSEAETEVLCVISCIRIDENETTQNWELN